MRQLKGLVLFLMVLVCRDEAYAADFEQEIRPILEAACVHCHGSKKQEGGLRLDNREGALKGGNGNGPAIVPGYSAKSFLIEAITLPRDDDFAMPPKKGWQLEASQIALLKEWIAEGADWPDNLVLQERPRVMFDRDIRKLLLKGGAFSAKERTLLRGWIEQGAPMPPGPLAPPPAQGLPEIDNLELTQHIRSHIVASSSEKTAAEMKSYRAVIPLTGIAYEMVPIPPGEFLMGSPPNEAHRKPDEGPQRLVKIEPFWMGKYEVTWEQFEPFMITDVPRNTDGTPQKVPPDAKPVDLVSSPTSPYTEMDFGMGKGDHPAVNMTHLAASKFCQWLSTQTGHYYRLPTEAEWEYACRAGTTTAYSFGNDPGKLAEYAIFWGNTGREGYARVGQKKPNAWGLHDMHGNVFEWCLDQYAAYAYQKPVIYVAAQSLYPRAYRGGSWYDDASDLRSAARFSSNPDLQMTDPMLPKSFWYLTDAHWLGFRMVRPLTVPLAEEMHRTWNPGDVSEIKDYSEEFQKLRQ